MFPFLFCSPDCSPSGSAAGVLAPLPAADPQGLAAESAAFGRKTPLLLLPGLKYVLVGLEAAGSAGKASLLIGFDDDADASGRDTARDVVIGWVGPEMAPPQGVADARPAPARFADPAGRAGNKLEFDVEPQLPVLPTDDLADCAVEVLSLRTLLLPKDAPSELDEATALDPGKDG